MAYPDNIEEARAELKAMRSRHKDEAKGLVRHINTLIQRGRRKGGRTTKADLARAEDIKLGRIRSDEPERIAEGMQPIERFAGQPMYPMPDPGMYWAWNEAARRHEQTSIEFEFNERGELGYRDGFAPDEPEMPDEE